MGHHGQHSNQKVIAIIPARYDSVRLPGKLLLPLGDKPLIIRTLEQAKKAGLIDDVIVATDSKQIFDTVTSAGGNAVMTSAKHQSGSDRIAEVAETLEKGSIIVNVQGDEPLISPKTIDAAVKALLDNDPVQMATTCEKFENAEDILNPNNVKVVCDKDENAIYFSRSPIPYLRNEIGLHGSLRQALESRPQLKDNFKKHTGLYVYRREFLLEYTKWPQTELEKIEMLEQLRALENGIKIKLVEVDEISIGIDTAEDLYRAAEILAVG